MALPAIEARWLKIYQVTSFLKLLGYKVKADFAKVNFMIEVGALDNNPDDTSRAWDNFGGRTRLERAQSFYQILKQIGVKAQFQEFPGIGHQEAPAMREAALKFFKGLTAV